MGSFAIDPADAATVAAQLGRPLRGQYSVAHRCRCGLPDVVQTAPRLPDGTPFPTLYYLTCPRASAAAGRLEASGVMTTMTARLSADEDLRRSCQAAHLDYLARRDEAARACGVQPLPAGTQSAGGMPARVKCLHALMAHELAVPGANPLGREAVESAGDWWAAGPCVPRPADVSQPAPAAAARRVAAIDCGTNSIRLLVADVDPVRRTLTDLDRRLEIVRLGQGVDKTGCLAPEALERTLGALAEYARIIRASRVDGVRMVATSATRDASNAAEFTRGVVDILGVEPEVLTGDEEARLSFAGATAEFGAMSDPPAPPYLVLDIGGGSTEFVLGGLQGNDGAARTGEVAAISLNIGCVRMTERHLHGDPPDQEQIAAAISDIDAALEEAAAKVAIAQARSLVGLAGSVTTVAAIALDLPRYDPARIHHARITAAQVRSVTGRLLAQTRQERSVIPAMHPGRVDVIGAGALVLDRVMRLFGFAEVVVSEHDILDGIAWSMLPSR